MNFTGLQVLGGSNPGHQPRPRVNSVKIIPNWYERRLRLMETNCGRDSGWHVERNGIHLAVLTDCRWEDMFWFSYRIEPMTDDPDFNQRLLSTFWEDENWIDVYYRNREFPELIVGHAFPSGIPFREPGRLRIRGHYFCPLPRMPWDYVLLWWRRRKRSACKFAKE
jgi:hypothetical protein